MRAANHAAAPVFPFVAERWSDQECKYIWDGRRYRAIHGTINTCRACRCLYWWPVGCTVLRAFVFMLGAVATFPTLTKSSESIRLIIAVTTQSDKDITVYIAYLLIHHVTLMSNYLTSMTLFSTIFTCSMRFGYRDNANKTEEFPISILYQSYFFLWYQQGFDSAIGQDNEPNNHGRILKTNARDTRPSFSSHATLETRVGMGRGELKRGDRIRVRVKRFDRSCSILRKLLQLA